MIAGQIFSVHENQIFIERAGRGDQLAICIHGEAAAIEDQLIVATYLIYVEYRDLEMARAGFKHFPPQSSLAHVIWRSIDTD